MIGPDLPASGTSPTEGPAILWLRLREAELVLQRPNLPDDSRRNVISRVEWLKKALMARPHVSLVDLAAKLRLTSNADVDDEASSERPRSEREDYNVRPMGLPSHEGPVKRFGRAPGLAGLSLTEAKKALDRIDLAEAACDSAFQFSSDLKSASRPRHSLLYLVDRLRTISELDL